MDGSKTKKKERERENGRESRSYASWETNRIGYAITLLRTDRRPRGDSFFADIYIFVSSFFFFFSCIKDRFPLFSFLQAIGGNLGDLCFVLFFFFLFLWLVTFHSTRLSNRREKGDRHSGLPPLPPSNFECHVSRRKSHDHPVVIYWQNRTNAQAMLLV